MSRIHGDDTELTAEDAAIIKGMIRRGDKVQDIAAFFGVNSRAVSNIRSGQKFAKVPAHPSVGLPPPGPYIVDESFVRFYKAMTRVNELWEQGQMKAAKSLFEQALKTPVRVPEQSSMEDMLDELVRDDLGRSTL